MILKVPFWKQVQSNPNTNLCTPRSQQGEYQDLTKAQGDVIKVLGNVYGSNDAPFNWYSTFDQAAQKVGFEKSQFDCCLYYLRKPDGSLCGVLGAHVDDTITGAAGAEYDEATVSGGPKVVSFAEFSTHSVQPLLRSLTVRKTMLVS